MSNIGLMNQAIVPKPPWCVRCFRFVMSALSKFPDLNINGKNLVLVIWFSVRQINSFSFSIYQEFRSMSTKLWGPITLNVFWNTNVVEEIIQRHICRHLLFGLTGIQFSKSSIRRSQKLLYSGPEISYQPISSQHTISLTICLLVGLNDILCITW